MAPKIAGRRRTRKARRGGALTNDDLYTILTDMVHLPCPRTGDPEDTYNYWMETHEQEVRDVSAGKPPSGSLKNILNDAPTEGCDEDDMATWEDMKERALDIQAKLLKQIPTYRKEMRALDVAFEDPNSRLKDFPSGPDSVVASFLTGKKGSFQQQRHAVEKEIGVEGPAGKHGGRRRKTRRHTRRSKH